MVSKIHFGLRTLLVHLTSPHYWGKVILKRKANAAGVATSALPEAAWDEITSRLIVIVRSQAWAPSTARDLNWRANLCRLCSSEAKELASVIKTRSTRSRNDPIVQILARHRVIAVNAKIIDLNQFRGRKSPIVIDG